MPSSHETTNGTTQIPTRRLLLPGIYVPTLCFFKLDSEDIDLKTISSHATQLASAGVTGLTVHGSNGEAVHLSNDERIAIIRTTREALDTAGFVDMPLISGCSAQSTRETIKLCHEAQSAGADYALILSASYYRSLFSSTSIIEFYTDVADASPIPVIIYNYPPAVSGLDLDSDALITLSRHPNIVGCKFTCGNTGKLNRVATSQHLKLQNHNTTKPPSSNSTPSSSSQFLCFGGSGDFTLQTLIGGGHGIIGGIGNIAPKTSVRVFDLYLEGQIEEARRVQDILSRGDWAAIKSGVVGIKSAMQTYSGYGGFGRKPLPRPTEEQDKIYAAEFRELVDFENSLS